MGKSLILVPNGNSNSMALKWMHQSTKIEKKEKSTAHTLGIASAAPTGTIAKWMICKIMLIWARG